MASLYRPVTITYLLPDGKHRTPDGGRVTKDTPGAQRSAKKSSVWYGKYRDAGGLVRRVPLCKDKTAAGQMLAKLVTDARMGSVGLGDDFGPFRNRLLVCCTCKSTGRKEDGGACGCDGFHLTEFRQHLEAKNNDSRYISQAIAHCRAVFAGIGAKLYVEVTAGRVADWLAEQRRTAGMGISTSNHYLVAVKSFCRWMVKAKRAATDPVTHVSRLNSSTDVRRQRRDLSLDEARALLNTALASSEVFRGLSGNDRYFLYAVAFGTGFRAGELASLTPESFALNGDPPTVRVQAAYSKNRKEAVQPLPVALAEALRPFLDGKPTGKAIWPGTWASVAWKMIAKDLADARATWVEEAKEDADERKRREKSDLLRYRDADGRTFDFHACRHSFITLLAKGGVHPKMAQSLARHSSITLTLDRYTHVGLYDQAVALAAIPSLLTGPPAPENLRATGTEPARPCPRPDLANEKTALAVRSGEKMTAPARPGAHKRLTAEKTGFANECTSVRRDDKRVGDGTRTRDFQIHSLTL
jgi:integrase